MVRPRHSNIVPGQHIYAYCNVKTHQVLYSLTRTLQHRQLQQLPDTGANNNPPNLRKDLWSPLWSVHLPDGEDGAAQGLHAFRMLRDFRVLHETTWEPPKSMSVPYTAKQIERLEKRLDGRGGSKKENAHDLIARKKWKMRVKMVMDQKTNSIADLAAVLLKQERGVEEQLMKRDRARGQEIREMEELAELWEKEEGAGKKELEAQIEEWKAMRDARKEDRRWRKLNGKVDAAQLRLGKMEFAAEWVRKAKNEAADATAAREAAKEQARLAREKARLEAEEAKAAAAKNTQAASTSTSTSAAEETAVQEEEAVQEEPEEAIEWTTFLPSFPSDLTRAPLTASKTTLKPTDTLKRHIPPVFAPHGEGVTVRWANTLDAEYAAQWPAHVRHEPMGMVRNTAPRADSETPFLEVADFKAVGWKSRREGFPVEQTLAEKIVERRGAMGMVEHPTLKNKFTRRDRFVAGEEMEFDEFEESSATKATTATTRMQQLEELKRDAMSSVQGTSPSHSQRLEGAAFMKDVAASTVEVRV